MVFAQAISRAPLSALGPKELEGALKLAQCTAVRFSVILPSVSLWNTTDIRLSVSTLCWLPHPVRYLYKYEGWMGFQLNVWKLIEWWQSSGPFVVFLFNHLNLRKLEFHIRTKPNVIVAQYVHIQYECITLDSMLHSKTHQTCCLINCTCKALSSTFIVPRSLLNGLSFTHRLCSHARCCPAPLGANRVQCLAQGHFGVCTVGAGTKTSNPSNNNLKLTLRIALKVAALKVFIAFITCHTKGCMKIK